MVGDVATLAEDTPGDIFGDFSVFVAKKPIVFVSSIGLASETGSVGSATALT